MLKLCIDYQIYFNCPRCRWGRGCAKCRPEIIGFEPILAKILYFVQCVSWYTYESNMTPNRGGIRLRCRSDVSNLFMKVDYRPPSRIHGRRSRRAHVVVA